MTLREIPSIGDALYVCECCGTFGNTPCDCDLHEQDVDGAVWCRTHARYA